MIVKTKDAYSVFKYDNDFVDELVYDDATYKHFVVFDGCIEVLNNEDCSIIASFENTAENYEKALELIK